MALGDPYATLAQLKVYLGGISDTVDDQVFTDSLNTESREIEKYCRRQFNDAGSASTRVYRAESSGLVYVDDFSTTTGLIVATDDDADGVYETTWTLTTDFYLEPANGIMDGEAGWPYRRLVATGTRLFPMFGRRPLVQVTARWGWTAVPAGVAQACKVLASELAKLKDAPFGVAGYGAYGPIRVRDNPIAMKLLSRYCLRPVLVG